MNCDYIFPDVGGPFAHLEDEILECMLHEGHTGNHLVQISENEFVAWRPNHECEDCKEDCQCILYSYVPKVEARKLLKQSERCT